MIAVAYLSELTYPLYLLHMFRPTFTTTSSVGLAVLFAVLLLLAATVLHLGVERPFLALRDRLDSRRTAWKEPAAAGRPQPERPLARHEPQPADVVTAEPLLSPEAAG